MSPISDAIECNRTLDVFVRATLWEFDAISRFLQDPDIDYHKEMLLRLNIELSGNLAERKSNLGHLMFGMCLSSIDSSDLNDVYLELTHAYMSQNWDTIRDLFLQHVHK